MIVHHIMQQRQSGFSLVELMLALMIGAMLFAGLNSVVGLALSSREATHEHKRLLEQAQFAMRRMTLAVRHSKQLLLPLNDDPATDWPEHIRKQTIPASPPVGSSTFASAVLAVALPEHSDLDNDGIADADDDGDGRIDEDLSADITNDGAPGIYLIDDDGDGNTDEGDSKDDDEDSDIDEDAIDNSDDDNDGSADEDTREDNNADICPGICGLDDDDDGEIDEGGNNDDDEDGVEDEDWISPVVFYLKDGNLVERTPVPWDTGNGSRDGLDFIETDIAENIAGFRIERISKAKKKRPLVDITLELANNQGDNITLNTRVRVGSAI